MRKFRYMESSIRGMAAAAIRAVIRARSFLFIRAVLSRRNAAAITENNNPANTADPEKGNAAACQEFPGSCSALKTVMRGGYQKISGRNIVSQIKAAEILISADLISREIMSQLS